jgi:hypothetical protein
MITALMDWLFWARRTVGAAAVAATTAFLWLAQPARNPVPTAEAAIVELLRNWRRETALEGSVG